MPKNKKHKNPKQPKIKVATGKIVKNKATAKAGKKMLRKRPKFTKEAEEAAEKRYKFYNQSAKGKKRSQVNAAMPHRLSWDAINQEVGYRYDVWRSGTTEQQHEQLRSLNEQATSFITNTKDLISSTVKDMKEAQMPDADIQSYVSSAEATIERLTDKNQQVQKLATVEGLNIKVDEARKRFEDYAKAFNSIHSNVSDWGKHFGNNNIVNNRFHANRRKTQQGEQFTPATKVALRTAQKFEDRGRGVAVTPNRKHIAPVAGSPVSIDQLTPDSRKLLYNHGMSPVPKNWKP